MYIKYRGLQVALSQHLFSFCWQCLQPKHWITHCLDHHHQLQLPKRWNLMEITAFFADEALDRLLCWSNLRFFCQVVWTFLHLCLVFSAVFPSCLEPQLIIPSWKILTCSFACLLCSAADILHAHSLRKGQILVVAHIKLLNTVFRDVYDEDRAGCHPSCWLQKGGEIKVLELWTKSMFLGSMGWGL